MSTTSTSGSLAQVAGADHAGSGTGEDGLDGSLDGEAGVHQRAIALDDHQRGADILLLQDVAHGGDELLDVGDEAGVECGGEGAARGVQVGGELVPAGDRQPGELAHQLAHAQLVGGVAHAEIARDGEGFGVRSVLADGCLSALQVEGRLLGAGDGVPALQEDRRVAPEGFAQACQAERIGGIAEQQQADGGAVSLYQGVGRQCGGDRDQGDGGMLAGGRQDGLDGVPDADREVVLGGEGFGGSQHAALFVEEDCVGVGAAGVDA